MKTMATSQKDGALEFRKEALSASSVNRGCVKP